MLMSIIRESMSAVEAFMVHMLHCETDAEDYVHIDEALDMMADDDCWVIVYF